VEAGVSTDGRTWQYNLQPLYNSKIEDLMKRWNEIGRNFHFNPPGEAATLRRGDDLILLQRNKVYSSVDEFLKNPPAMNKVALYNYDLKTNYLYRVIGRKFDHDDVRQLAVLINLYLYQG